MGFKSTNVDMQISFGKGEEKFWTNVFPSELVAKHTANIKKFGRVLKIIKTFEPIFAVMSVQAMLKLFRFPRACSYPHLSVNAIADAPYIKGFWRSTYIPPDRLIYGIALAIRAVLVRHVSHRASFRVRGTKRPMFQAQY